MDALGAPFHVKREACGFEFRFNRVDKAFDVGIARSFCGVQRVFDGVVSIVLQILQAEVFEFAFQLVQSQLVSKWRIEIAGFFAHLLFGFHGIGVANLPHDVHPVGNHDEDDAHVFRERDEQVSEVLALDDGILFVEFVDFHQTMDDVCHTIAILLANILQRQMPVDYQSEEDGGQHTIAFQPNFVDSYLCRAQRLQHRIKPKHVALDFPVGNRLC